MFTKVERLKNFLETFLLSPASGITNDLVAVFRHPSRMASGSIREAGREADDEATFLPLSDPDPNPDIGGRQRVAPPKHTSTPSAEKDAVSWRT